MSVDASGKLPAEAERRPSPPGAWTLAPLTPRSRRHRRRRRRSVPAPPASPRARPFPPHPFPPHHTTPHAAGTPPSLCRSKSTAPPMPLTAPSSKVAPEGCQGSGPAVVRPSACSPMSPASVEVRERQRSLRLLPAPYPALTRFPAQSHTLPRSALPRSALPRSSPPCLFGSHLCLPRPFRPQQFAPTAALSSSERYQVVSTE